MKTIPLALAIFAIGCSEPSPSGTEPTGNGVSTKPLTTNKDPGKNPDKAQARPRIVLDAQTIKALKGAASENAGPYKTLLERCRVFSSGDKSAGYLGLQWSEAVISLSLCWHASGEERYADLAVRYLTALLDDRERMGDGRGGNEEVRRNSGYPIRAHGVGAALGYDWLYNAKAMTPALRTKIAERLNAWLAWYGEKGYLNDNPYANYFWGYMSALSLAALSLDGDFEEASAWSTEATRLLEKTVIPSFADKLRGGTWAEGWQYGPLVAVNLAMIVRGYQTARGLDYSAKLPWFHELVRGQLHRLHPSRETAYSNGTHRVKPSLPSTTPLQAAIFFASTADVKTGAADLAARARFIEKKLLPPTRPKYAWFALLSSLGGDDQVDPLSNEPLSYHLAGPGLTFARSGWDKRAVWASFQAGAKIAVDHQHNDQGHFELWRGSDALFVDGGDTAAFATINHNSLLIDDAGRTLNYSPNQGVWARDSKTVGYSDDGRAVVAVGDLAGAWDPKCALRGCKQRTVNKATRTFIFVRPNVLIIDDQVSVESERDRVTWAGHVRAIPQIRGTQASVEVGGSRADLSVLLPVKGRLRAPKEPTTAVDHVYRRNEPKGDVWRLEIPSATTSKDRRFRVWMSAANRGATAAPVRAASDAGFDSVLGRSSKGDVSVWFAKSPNGGAGSATSNATVVAVGLEPKASYRFSGSMTRRHGVNGEHGTSCRSSLTRDAKGTLVASDAGSISLALTQCKPVATGP